MALDPKTHNVFPAAAKFRPTPAPTAENLRPRTIPSSFQIIIVGQ
jgi:hypothetical protein